MIGSGRLRSSWGAFGLVIGFCWVPHGVADSFHLKSGDVIVGEIVQATRNTVTIRDRDTISPLSFSSIDRVVVSLDDGSELSGDLFSWKGGVYEIRSADVLIRVQDGVILEDAVDTASTTEEPAPLPTPSPPKTRPAIALAIKGMPELTLKNGKVLVGTIIHATGSIVTVRLGDGGLVPASRAEIETVKFSGKDGGVVDGSFVGWSDDVYQLQGENQQILASINGYEAASTKLELLSSQQADMSQPEAETAAPELETTDAAITPVEKPPVADEEDQTVPQTPSLEVADAQQEIEADIEQTSDLIEETGAGGPVSETAVAGLADTTSPVEDDEPTQFEKSGPRFVEPKVEDVVEDGEEVVFQFHLDRPAERPLVILYAATNDTAHAGKDFEPMSGVVTFVAGSEYAEVRVPLIDDDQRENIEQFHLFLSSDPEIIQFSRRQVAATINDND